MRWFFLTKSYKIDKNLINNANNIHLTNLCQQYSPIKNNKKQTMQLIIASFLSIVTFSVFLVITGIAYNAIIMILMSISLYILLEKYKLLIIFIYINFFISYSNQ